ncbi:MAG TPA: phenylacetic acid degradation operon negative regulatory protein PaaX [Candidatus Competibacteraceae bacterium]|nr:phenylacetic acid degradation operon negative regulatory protein PaaX [Candidatus Competibacteraceae bacterium]
MTYHDAVERLMAEFRERRPLRAGSLIITVYGDAIAPHGGRVWLGSLIRLLEPFGLNGRLVRTSVFRLSKESWLTSEQVGRRSYYSLTSAGRRRFESAYRRIYAVPQSHWDGQWCLVFAALPGLDGEQREQIRRELSWQGFGMIAPGVLAHPGRDTGEVMDTLQALEVQDKVVVMTARSEERFAGHPLQEWVGSCWNLQQLSQDYRQFLERYRPLWRSLNAAEGALDPEPCFLVRTLLIHDYRRVLLRDPQLPDELLPADWAGTAARLLCRNLYRLVQEPSERHLMQVLETADGPLPQAAPYFYARFGGL